MPKSPNKTPKVRLQGEARKEKLIVLKSARKFRELNKWYLSEAAGLGMTRAKRALGVGTEVQLFILRKLSLQEQARKRAIELLTEDGRNLVLMAEANARVPFDKADFLARIDHALKVLPDVREELIKGLPHGKEIPKGLARVREQLAAETRQTSVGGAAILMDISIINMLKLRQIIGEEKFNELRRLTGETMREIQERGY